MGSQLQDLTGKTFGHWTVIRRVKINNRRYVMWECRCVCGNVHQVIGGHLKAGKSKSCGCKNPKGKNHKQWNGYGDISGNYWCCIQRGANGKKGNRKSVEFSITIQHAWDLFVKQNYKCKLTGLPLSINYQRKTGPIHTASLDRIDSAKGYTVDNIQWVHKDINMMKRVYDQDYFINMCNMVTSHCNNTLRESKSE